MDQFFEEIFTAEEGSPREEFLRRLDCAKRLVLEGDLNTRSRVDIKTSLYRLSRRSPWLVDQGLISVHHEQEMAMACFFWEFGKLFKLRTVLESFARSVSLLRNLSGTFLELYLEPDFSFAKLFDETGSGIFSLPGILMEASPLINRFGEPDNRQIEFRNQRWEIPLVYMLCGAGLELYRGTSSMAEVFHTLRASLNKLSFTLQSSRDAGLALFMLDSFLLDNKAGKALPGMTLELVKKTLAVQSYSSLHTAAKAACLSQTDINARCIQLLLSSECDHIYTIGDDLLRSFSIGPYIKELEKKKESIINHSISQTMRADILQPSYALHAFIEYRIMFGRTFEAIQMASEMEQHQFIFGQRAVEDAYKLIVNYYFQSNMLLYGTWQSSYAQEYLHFTGVLGFEVLLQTVASLPTYFPASHYTSEERHYISTQCTKSVISLLVHKRGERTAISLMSKYMPDFIPEFTDIDKGIDWAKRIMKQANPIPTSIELEEIGPLVRAKLYSFMGRMDEVEESSESVMEQEEDEESVPSTSNVEVNVLGGTEGAISQGEDGYDAEDSQDHSLTEDDDEPRTPSLSGIAATLIHNKRKIETDDFSSEHPNASLQLDPGYDADSQGQTDIEEARKTKKCKVETGYEGGESQGHTDEEEEEEEASRENIADENIAGSLSSALAETELQRHGTLNGVSRARDETPSDGMSAADELTSCHDEDIGAESSELDEGNGPAAPMNLPASVSQPRGSVLVQYATEAQQNFLSGRLSFVNSSFATDDAVLDSASQAASIESMDVSEAGHSVEDHGSNINLYAGVSAELAQEFNHQNDAGAHENVHDSSLPTMERNHLQSEMNKNGKDDDSKHVWMERGSEQNGRDEKFFESDASTDQVTQLDQPVMVSAWKRPFADMENDNDEYDISTKRAASIVADASTEEPMEKRPRRECFSNDDAKTFEDSNDLNLYRSTRTDGSQQPSHMERQPEIGFSEQAFRGIHDSTLFPIREEAGYDATEHQNLSSTNVDIDSGMSGDVRSDRQSGDHIKIDQMAMQKEERVTEIDNEEHSVASSIAREKPSNSTRIQRAADANVESSLPMSTIDDQAATVEDEEHSLAASTAQEKSTLERNPQKADVEPETPLRVTRSRRTKIGDDDEHSVASSIAQEKPPCSMRKSDQAETGEKEDLSIASSVAQEKPLLKQNSKIIEAELGTPLRATRSRTTTSGDDGHSVAFSTTQEKSTLEQIPQKTEPETPLRVTRSRKAKIGDDDENSVASSIAREKPPRSTRKSKGIADQAERGGKEDHSIASSVAQEKSLLKQNPKIIEAELGTPLRATRSRTTKSGDDGHSVASSVAKEKPPRSTRINKAYDSQASMEEEQDPSTVSAIAKEKPSLKQNTKTPAADLGPPQRVTRNRKKESGDDDENSVASSIAREKPPRSTRKSKGIVDQAERGGKEDHSASSVAQEKSLLKQNPKIIEAELGTPLRATRSRTTKSGDDGHSVASSVAKEKPPRSTRKNIAADAIVNRSFHTRTTHAQAGKDREDDHPIAVSPAQEKRILKQGPETPLRVTRSRNTKTGDDDGHSVASSSAQKKPSSSQKKCRVVNRNAEPSQATGQAEDDDNKETVAGLAASTPMRLTRNRAAKIAEEAGQSRILRSQKKTRGADKK